MKKIFITGGSSGIGLEITNQYSDFEITNFDISNGDDITSKETIERIIKSTKVDKPDYIFLNAGIGAFGPISELNYEMIGKMFEINTLSNMRIISGLFEEIKNGDIKVIVTLSTASFINGAFESIYNASKKAMREFVVSTNTELKDSGSTSFVFSFVPHYISGTGLTGGEKNNDELELMITSLRKSIENNEQSFIPKYDEIYKKVFETYSKDPIGQGIASLEYKRSKGKL